MQSIEKNGVKQATIKNPIGVADIAKELNRLPALPIYNVTVSAKLIQEFAIPKLPWH